VDALLVVDYQRAVFEGSPPTHRAYETAETLRVLAGAFRTHGLPVVYLRHSEDGSPWERAGQGWPICEILTPEAGDAIVDKSSCDGFRETRLAEILRARSINRLHVGGYATEFCVDTTIRSAASRNIQIVAVSDAHTTRDRTVFSAFDIIAHHNWVWSNIANPGNPIAVKSAAEVLGELMKS
jgi:nicotinamidase-related amidase